MYTFLHFTTCTIKKYGSTFYVGIGQVRSRKNKAEESRKLTDYFPLLSIAKRTLLVPLTFVKFEKKTIKFCSFSSCSSHITRKLTMLCASFQHTNRLLMKIILTCLELHVSYDWWVMASKLSPRHIASSFGHLFGFSHNCVYYHSSGNFRH